MSFDYKTLITLPEDLGLGIILKFITKTKNSRLRPSNIDSDCPPVFFWWLEEEDKKAIEFITNAVKSFHWQDEWTVESRGNGKWLLYPEHIRDGEKIARGVINDEEKIDITDNGVGWLMKNEPEFGLRTNKDLRKFKAYFRSLVEDYLKEKEKNL